MTTLEKIEQTLQQIFEKIGIDPIIRFEETETELFVYMDGENLNFMIGYHGESLDALQHIVTLLHMADLEDNKRLILDINGYRLERKGKVEEITKRHIDRVRFFSQEVEMPPMSSHERRHVHLFVEGYADVKSESAGEGKFRHVVLKPAKNKDTQL
jgi:spoIIIJ-associated protein